MHCLKRLIVLVPAALAFAAAGAVARAQEPPASPAPSPMETAQPTFMDRQYDGKIHAMVAPYIWGPTVKLDTQFAIPTLRHGHGGGLVQSSFQVGPSDYLPKLNSAGMLAFDVRQGDVDVFGDAIYLNASTSATVAGSIAGPRGKRQVPITIDANAHLSTAIWEAAAGFTLAHSHSADVSMFLGVRNFPLTLNMDYTATIGKRGIVAPTGSLTTSDYTSDVIWGVRGRVFFNGDRIYVPYYFDYGTGSNNTSWQAYGGAGYAFHHGQTLVALWRALNYTNFPPPPTSHVQKLNLSGPLLGYTIPI
jgi:hypothetical protein